VFPIVSPIPRMILSRVIHVVRAVREIIGVRNIQYGQDVSTIMLLTEVRLMCRADW
jgi:hypothetical protein